MRNVKNVATLIGMALAARTAVQRLRQARDNRDDRLELLDAALNVAVIVTGVLVIVRRLRRGDLESEGM